MRIVRFLHSGEERYGRVVGDRVQLLAGPPWPVVNATDDFLNLDQVVLLAPVQPTKVVAVGLNYRRHASELSMEVPEEPLIFLKPPSAVIGPGEPVIKPGACSQLDYEAELGIVISGPSSNVSPADASGAILGWVCANDVTARDLQGKDGQWTRAKGFDSFCPLGPWVETELDVDDLRISLLKNGEVRQDDRTSGMIFGPQTLVSFVSGVMTLLPGDVILTGTPAGVGPMAPGDVVEVRIEGIGSLKNPVEAGVKD